MPVLDPLRSGLSEYRHGNRNAIVAKGAAGAWWQISPQTDLLAEREREKDSLKN